MKSLFEKEMKKERKNLLRNKKPLSSGNKQSKEVKKLVMSARRRLLK